MGDDDTKEVVLSQPRGQACPRVAAQEIEKWRRPVIEIRRGDEDAKEVVLSQPRGQAFPHVAA